MEVVTKKTWQKHYEGNNERMMKEKQSSEQEQMEAPLKISSFRAGAYEALFSASYFYLLGYSPSNRRFCPKISL